MKIGVFLSADNKWFLLTNSNLEHQFHPKLDNSARALGEKDIKESEIQLVHSPSYQPFLSIAHIQIH